VTRDSLIVSGETSRGYYIFQLANFGPDHALAQPRGLVAVEALFGSPSLALPLPNESLEKTFVTYEYLKYVIDPMCSYQ
jgi:hypothetical protein